MTLPPYIRSRLEHWSIQGGEEGISKKNLCRALLLLLNSKVLASKHWLSTGVPKIWGPYNMAYRGL